MLNKLAWRSPASVGSTRIGDELRALLQLKARELLQDRSRESDLVGRVPSLEMACHTADERRRE